MSRPKSRPSKRFRHSTTFYRKLNNEINTPDNDYLPSHSVNQNYNEELSDSQSHDLVTANVDNADQENCSNASHILNETRSKENFNTIGSVENVVNGSSEHNDVASDKPDFKMRIRHWAIKHKIRQSALNELLEIFRDNQNMNFMPKDSRTLLHTPRTNNIVIMGSGQYWYNGLENCLKQVLLSPNMVHLPPTIDLTFNIDGLPIAKSSKNQFWPILCKIEKINMPPLVTAIYYGSTKPPVNDFLQPFVNELSVLLKDGLLIKNQIIKVKNCCFVCDTPARCFVKGTVSFNSYHGCMKCIIVGEYDRKERHMSFPRSDLPLRTNDSFRNRSDPFHHKEITVIEDLPIDLVDDFPVADALHLLHLGVMKKCLMGWISGSYNYRTKWSARDIQGISNKLLDIKTTTPFEIHQGRLREIDTIHFWKAAEFRNFLLYYGPVVLKDYLPFEVYQHFLTLFCATTICSSNAYKNYLHVAQKLFQDYIEKFIEIYGQDSISSNVHNLCHIVNDVIRFGPLPNRLSAYPFENMLFRIKNLLRKGGQPLAQVANRLHEQSKLNFHKNIESFPILKYEKNLDTGNKVFTVIRISDTFLLSSRNNKDKWFLSTNNDIIEMEYAFMNEDKIKIKGKKLKNKYIFFDRPFDSSFINVYSSSRERVMEESELFGIDNVKCKLTLMAHHDEVVFIPILSTFI